MRRRRRAAHVLQIHQARVEVAHPELAHRNLDLALVEQRVLGHLERHAGGLGVDAETLLAQFLGQCAVVCVGPQIGECAAEIPEEAVADVGAVDDAAGEHGEVRRRIVARRLRNSSIIRSVQLFVPASQLSIIT
jgi:hypothetical protein